MARVRYLIPLLLITLLTACGEEALDSLGFRSSGWINEPEVVTTTFPLATAPRIVDSRRLLWSNDEIVTQNLDDPNLVVQEVFGRRQGDRFIQASRFEIAVALPQIVFPGVAPYPAEWVSSQLVIENTGLLSDDPSAAFGIWSDEPYSRSRSVAQMVVLRVATDPDSAAELSVPGAEISCDRFADRSNEDCSTVSVAGRDMWRLASNNGNTLIWFEGPYRYELFGRTFVPVDVLEEMAATPVPLSDLADNGS